MRRREFLAVAGAALTVPVVRLTGVAAAERHLLYIAEPGIRNYVEYGGVGVLVYDIDAGYKFVKRIPTWDVPAGPGAGERQGRRGERAGPAGSTSPRSSGSARIDLVTEQDGVGHRARRRLRSAGDLAGRHDALRAVVRGAALERHRRERRRPSSRRSITNSGAHNTIYSLDGTRASTSPGLKSPLLSVADTKTHTVVKTRRAVRGTSIRPFTVNARADARATSTSTSCSGSRSATSRPARCCTASRSQGFKKGPVKRHGCPSHGIGLTPDEKEVWVCDGHNNAVHVFDNTVMPPKQIATLKVRDQPAG